MDPASIASAITESNPVLARHPGAVDVAQFYASTSKTEVQAALAHNSNGKLRIASNNLQLGQTSNFTINDSSLLYCFQLCASITPGANNAPQCEGWLFQAIDNIQAVFVGSTLPQMNISGALLREYMLACCPDAVTRRNLLRTAGKVGSVATAVTASIPIGWALASGLGICKDFPIDMSFFKGPLQFNIKFNPSNFFITGTGTGAAAPSNTALVSSFNDLYITCSTTEIETPGLKLNNVYAMNPGLEYFIPGEYLSQATYVQQCTPGSPSTLVFNSCPDGMLEAIILLIKPVAEFSSASGAAGAYVYPGSVELSKLSLLYGGNILFQAESNEELKQYYRTHFAGDTKEYQYNYLGPNIGATGAITDPTYVVSRDAVFQAVMNSSSYLIPLCYDGKSTLSSNMTENLRNFASKTLTLNFTPALRSRISATSGFASITAADTVRGGSSAQDYAISMLFVTSSVFGGTPVNPTLVYSVPANNS